MADDLVVLDGSTFFVSDRCGDVEPNGEANGFFIADMRHLSAWRLLVDGQPLRLLSTRTPDYYSARIFGTLATARVGVNPSISIRRDRFVSDGVHEDLMVENHSEEDRSIRIEIRFQADFRDLFEVKAEQPKRGHTSAVPGHNRVTLAYERGSFSRTTIITFNQACQVGEDSATFSVTLKPRQGWHVCIDVLCVVNGKELGPGMQCGAFGSARPKMPLSLEQWLDDAPRLDADWDALRHTYRQSLLDLAALRFRPSDDVSWSLPAAGLPWFMTVFGRDSLITSYQALPFQPHLAETTLEALAAMQATHMDDYRDAEPGKILHELRRGELAVLGEIPHTPYYGTHDATPLFLVLLDEYERWTGDQELVRRLEPAARAAITWIEHYGDLDQDGYLEYRTRSPQGLINQGWKDSWNSIRFADGRIAEPPIATCELQGYAYDARLRAARLARAVWNDHQLADRLERDAGALRQRFNSDFWSERRSSYVLALDGAKHQVDSVTSNIGHLLWSGIVDPDRAARVVRQLMSAELFSGWGIRTMAMTDAGYNPIEYHNGTVWPHDTSIIAEGLRRYGYRAEASSLAMAIIETAGCFAYRLPELFAGFSREATGMPVDYPTPSRPQAWAAAAPLMALRTFLGLDVIERTLHSDPHLPAGVGRIALHGIAVCGQRADAGGAGGRPGVA